MRVAILTLFLLPLVASADVSLFQTTYADSRIQYLRSVAAVETSKDKSIYQMQFPDPDDASLVTDVTWIHHTKKAPTLIVIISGLHGIEGFTGSAVQSYILKNIKANSPSDYLFVHALNPYGFKNFRRTDRNNIDLNRNFSADEKQYLTKNANYSEINSFLNPSTSVKLNFLSKPLFVFSALKLIYQNSTEMLRRSILLGQYSHPKGIYYGGLQPAYQKTILDQLHSEIFTKYAQVFVVDLHTGYGEKNKLHILANSKSQPTAPLLNTIFSPGRIDYGDQKSFYKVTGDMLSYLGSKSDPGNLIFGVVFEFGTLNSQQTLGSIESLRRIILENQKFHFSAISDSAKNIDSLFLDLFYPTDIFWREQVLKNSLTELQKVESYLVKMPQ